MPLIARHGREFVCFYDQLIVVPLIISQESDAWVWTVHVTLDRPDLLCYVGFAYLDFKEYDQYLTAVFLVLYLFQYVVIVLPMCLLEIVFFGCAVFFPKMTYPTIPTQILSTSLLAKTAQRSVLMCTPPLRCCKRELLSEWR